MKQIKAFVQSDKLKAVVEAIESKDVGGISVIPVRGRGKADRPTVAGQRGTSRHVAEYNSLDAVLVVVPDSQASIVEDAIIETASTRSKGDGKIFVSSVDRAIDIGSKTSGDAAL
jgi:nitrogen regulatory protein PII